jgi:hypothetical protein
MNPRIALCFPLLFGLAAPAIAEVCKYVDTAGNVHFTSDEPEKEWQKIWCSEADQGTGAGAGAGVGVGVVTGPSSILPQCMDTPEPGVPGVVTGPSARARECTRQYCARPEYQAKVTAYAMNRPQSNALQAQALTCITRAEQDKAGK